MEPRWAGTWACMWGVHVGVCEGRAHVACTWAVPVGRARGVQVACTWRARGVHEACTGRRGVHVDVYVACTWGVHMQRWIIWLT